MTAVSMGSSSKPRKHLWKCRRLEAYKLISLCIKKKILFNMYISPTNLLIVLFSVRHETPMKTWTLSPPTSKWSTDRVWHAGSRYHAICRSQHSCLLRTSSVLLVFNNFISRVDIIIQHAHIVLSFEEDVLN